MQKQPIPAPSVRIAFRTFGRTLRHSYENLGNLLMGSFLWWVGALLIVSLGPATAALHRMTQRMTEERASSWMSFGERFREDWGWSSRLVWTLLLGLVLWEINRSFYQQSPSPTVQLFSGVFLVITILWIGMLLYAVPVALRQTEPRLGMTLRNTALMVIANLPGMVVSLVLLFLSCLVLLIPPLFLILPGWIALWGEENVRLLLVASGYLPPDEFADSPRRR